MVKDYADNQGDHLSGYTYAPRKGYRISKKDAPIIGKAIEAVRSSVGQGFSVDDFAAYCERSSGPIHDIWERRRNLNIAAAGTEAARYLMNGVLRVPLKISYRNTATTTKTVALIPQSALGKKESVFTSDEVRSSPDLLKQAEEKMLRQIRGEMDSFSLIAGKTRTVAAVQRLLAAY